LFSPSAESKPAFIVALFSSNLPDFFFYEVEKETDKPNSEAIAARGKNVFGKSEIRNTRRYAYR